MERIINLHIEKLPDESYLATSDDIQGLVAQGRTVSEVMEIARDVAKRFLEAQKERQREVVAPVISNSFDCTLVVSS